MNSRRTPIIIIIAIIILGVIGVIFYALTHNNSSNDTMGGMNMKNTSSKSDTKAVATSSVKISNFAFSPAHITVKAGTKVTWTNEDSIAHSATSDDGKFDTGLVAQGKSGSFTFEKPGTYHYHCMPHPYMKGTVTVTN